MQDFTLPDISTFPIPQEAYDDFLHNAKSQYTRQYFLTALQMANSAFVDAWWSFFMDKEHRVKRNKIDHIIQVLDTQSTPQNKKKVDQFSKQFKQGDTYTYRAYLHGDSALDFLNGNAIEAIKTIANSNETAHLMLQHWQYHRVIPVQSFADISQILQSSAKVRNYIIHPETTPPCIHHFIYALYFIAIFLPPMISKIFFDRIQVPNPDKNSHKKYIAKTCVMEGLIAIHTHFSDVHGQNMHNFHRHKMSREHQRNKVGQSKHQNDRNRKARNQTKYFHNQKQHLQQKYRCYVHEGTGLRLWKFVKYYNFIGKKNLDRILQKMGFENGTRHIENASYNSKNPSFTFDIMGAYVLNIHIGFVLYGVYMDIYNHVLSHMPLDKKGKPIFEKKANGQNKDLLQDILKNSSVKQQVGTIFDKNTIKILNVPRNNVQHNRLFDSELKDMAIFDIFNVYIRVCTHLNLHTAREKIIHQIYTICKKQDYAIHKETGKKVKQDGTGYYYYEIKECGQKTRCSVCKDIVYTRPYIRKYARLYNKNLIKAIKKNGYKISH